MPLQYVYLIDPQTIKSNSAIIANVDEKYLSIAARRAQDMNLQDTLGTKLYKKLQELVSTSTIDSQGNEVYADLYYNYAVFTLIEYSVYYALLDLSIRISNKSVGRLTGPDEQPLDAKDLNSIMNRLKETADYYNKKMGDFLRQNYNDYPELNTNTEIQESVPSMGNRSDDIYFRDTISECRMGYTRDLNI